MQLREWLKRLVAAERSAPQSKTLEAEAEDKADAEDEADAEVEAVDPFNPFPEPVRLEATDIFDLHTIAPREVKRVVEEYLREAHEAGFRSVRIIHGKGRGVQREMVRSILKRTPFVSGWTDAPPEAGGWGATLVLFTLKEK
ncbi:MAG TPA: Smr/MutS family protein [Pyrinomonadaceae bacterium]|jgi:DNA-nicking Smr family endonuclease